MQLRQQTLLLVKSKLLFFYNTLLREAAEIAASLHFALASGKPVPDLLTSSVGVAV